MATFTAARHLALVGIIILTIFSTRLVSAQCGGTYFAKTYRAVDRVEPLGGIPYQLADWTGDGRKDFWNFRPNPSTSTTDILIYPAKPTGFWDWDNPIVYSTSIPSGRTTFNSSNTVLDFNSDGNIDLLSNDRIHQNSGGTSLNPLAQISHSDVTVAALMGTLAYTDLNADGYLDWIYYASVHPTGQEIRYQLGNADGSFSYRVIVAAHTLQNGLNNSEKAVGDFDGDGDIDIAYSKYPISGIRQYAVIKNTGGGVFEVGQPIPIDVEVDGIVRDLNNDSRADIITNLNSSLIILFGQANATFLRTEVPNAGAGALPGDLDGDGDLDLLEPGLTSYATLTNNGSGVFTRTVYQRALGGAFHVEDFSGDGKADVFNGMMSNLFNEQIVVVSENSCNAVNEPKFMNFGSDLTTDLAMWNATTGNWTSKNLITGNSTPSTVFNWGHGSHGDIPSPGDFDGDNITDYSVFRNSTGVWYIRRSSDTSWLVFPFGLSGDIPVPNDYNGGGKTDIAVFRPSDGNWHIMFSETQQYQALHFGANGDRPVPADYDGDWKTDIAVYRSSDGTWYYLNSSDSQVGIIRWGINTDVPLPGDFDGDKKADLVVYRAGIWYILRSLDGSYAVLYWGTTGDIPAVVPNGILAGPFVYRPIYSFWYPYSTLFPTSVVPLGGEGDVPVYFGLPNNLN